MMILSPVAIPSDRPRLATAPVHVLPGGRQRGAVGLLSNGKPNVEHLFRGVEEHLRRAGFTEFLSREKPTVDRPVAEPILRELVAGCGLVITAMCD